MSHFTTIRTEIRELEILLEALKEIGLTIKREGNIGGYGGRGKQPEIAVYSKGHCRWGFRRNSKDGTFEVTGQYETLNASENKQLLRRVTQEYGRRKVLVEMRRRGYALACQQVNPEGAIKLVFRKVSARAA